MVPENCIAVSHALSTCNAALQCYRMQNANNATAVQTYNITTGAAVLTVLRVHSVCVLWESSYYKNFTVI